MTPRGSDAVESGAGTRIPVFADTGAASQPVPPQHPEPDTTGGTDPLVNRFPTIAFSYDTDASRLVMLYRDPANGKTVSQIPTEAALKQYKEAQQKEKDAERASMLTLTVDGSGQGGGHSAAYGRAGNGLSSGTGSAAAVRAASDAGAGRSAAATPNASAASPSVAHSSPVAAASAGTSAGRVNVVI
ncbi:hypothetical protein [Azospirillum sp. B506]|uniref:hypothetical protein n=1 Tax=Azospirillum sp. B506 TaxID=137721 RepID=UPI00131EEBC2|nr:hypothetical protein [Azospirillum sp. B506]